MAISAAALAAALDGLHAPWGSVPWGSVEGGDLSVADPAVALRSWDGELAWLLRIQAWDPATGSDSPVYVSSHGYHTGGDGASLAEGIPVFQHFPPGLMNPGSSRLTLVSGGTIRLGATPTHGTIQIANADGAFDAMLGLRLRERPYDLWVGRAEWMGPSFAEFARHRRGLIADATWDYDSITLTVLDPRQRFEQLLNPDVYLGFGVAVRVRAAGDGVQVAADVKLHPAALHVRVMFEVEALANMVLLNYGWEETNRVGWELRLMADGSLLWVQDDWAPYVLSPTGIVTAKAPHRASVGGGSGGVILYLDGDEVARDAAPYVASTLVTPSTQDFWIGKRGSF
jgi:hypothetical protein